MNFIEISRGIVVAALIIETIIDIRKKKIWIPLCLICSVAAVIIQLIAGKNLFETIVLGTVAMIGFYIISIISREQIGKGDAFLFGMTGCTLGPECFFGMLYICFFMTFIIALILVVFFKKKKKDSFPLAPFVAVSYVLMIFF